MYVNSPAEADGGATAVGLMRPDGSLVTDCDLTSVKYSGTDKYMMVLNKDGKVGLLTRKGDTVLPFEYKFMKDRGNDMFVVENEAGAGVFDADNRTMTLPIGKYSSIGNTICNGRAVWIGKNGKWGIATGDLSREIIKPLYKDEELSVGNTYGGDYTFHIKKNGTVSVVNFDGKTIIPLGRYTGIKGYDKGYIAVRKGNKLGLCDEKTGRQIVAPLYDEIVAIGNGKILVANNTDTGGVYSVIDKNTGNLVKKQAFSRSQSYSLSNFMQNYLGNFILTFEFTY